MKNFVKVTVIAVFGVFGLGLFLQTAGASMISAGADPAPTPPNKNANKMANMPSNKVGNANMSMPSANANANMAMPVNAANMANTAVSTPTPPAGNTGGNSGKTIPKEFTLGTDSLDSQYGEVPFNHDNHAFMKYSPDGNSVMGCIECHHTDAPKSALKPPYVTSERDVVLTIDTWRASNQPVTHCRACHFQQDNVPEGKEMPKTDKELDNRIAYHKNCNECHDEAARLRPNLKSKPGFATGKDCAICHKPI
jgi:hypothetical protein